jgi:hypothetical protein
VSFGFIIKLFRGTARGGAKPPSSTEISSLHPIATLSLIPLDEGLLARARTQWQFGDWESLTAIEDDHFSSHPERVKLALMVAMAHAQLGAGNKARTLFRKAKEWGCGDELLGQVLISGVHNSLGRASTLAGHSEKAQTHFQSSVQYGMPNCDTALIGPARASMQLQKISPARSEKSRPESIIEFIPPHTSLE